MQGPGGLFLLRERHHAAARLSVLRPEDGPHALESRFQRAEPSACRALEPGVDGLEHQRRVHRRAQRRTRRAEHACIHERAGALDAALRAAHVCEPGLRAQPGALALCERRGAAVVCFEERGLGLAQPALVMQEPPEVDNRAEGIRMPIAERR